MRRKIKHLSAALGLAALPLLLACEEPTRPGLEDGDALAGLPHASGNLWVEIQGPTSIGALETCSWSAMVGGVRGRYSIEWLRRDAEDESWRQVERLPVYGGGMSGHLSFDLKLEVRDSADGLATAEMTVQTGPRIGCVDESEDG
jgi:hypothetical protein